MKKSTLGVGDSKTKIFDVEDLTPKFSGSHKLNPKE
jgi:hypothetical protein